MLRSNFPWRRRQHGAAVVEFALVSAVYLFLILLVIEFGLLFWIDLTMQHAVREGARYAITGQSNLDPNVSNQQRYLAVIEKMKEQSMGHWDDVHPQISITRGGSTADAIRTRGATRPECSGRPVRSWSSASTAPGRSCRR